MKNIFFLSVTFFLVLSHLHAQEFSTGIQLRPRFEYRNGFKTLLGNEQEATAFISQRSRLNLLYQEEKISVKLTFQKVRTWGDVPTVTTADKSGIAVFEAMANIILNPDFFLDWTTGPLL